MTQSVYVPARDPSAGMPGIPLPGRRGLELFVRRSRTTASPSELIARPAVLYVHGATFPSGLSIGYPFDGRSWADELVAAGFDVWAFDLAGYGYSARYPERSTDPAGGAPLGRAPHAADQIVSVLRHIVARRSGGRVSLLAHSWGTIAAGLAATLRPDLVDRLVLFGPIARRSMPDLPAPSSLGSWHAITAQAQHDRFVEDVPDGHSPVLTDQFAQWAADWLATDPTAASRTPPSVCTPSGPRADIYAAWSGELAYNPRLVQAPTCIVRGEWDSLCTDADAQALLGELTAAPIRQDVKLDEGTHLMHLESGRFALYATVSAFLRAPAPPAHRARSC